MNEYFFKLMGHSLGQPFLIGKFLQSSKLISFKFPDFGNLTFSFGLIPLDFHRIYHEKLPIKSQIFSFTSFCVNYPCLMNFEKRFYQQP